MRTINKDRLLTLIEQVKSVNENVLYTVDLIHDAIHGNKQIAFQYCGIMTATMFWDTLKIMVRR